MASAADGWQRVGGAAPGGDDFAVIDGVPHVAWTSSTGVHVSRLDSAPGPWESVGGPIRHAGGVVAEASLASDSAGNPWVAWTETDGAGAAQVRVARFNGVAWHEVVGGARPLNPPPPTGGPYQNSGYEPQIAFYEGRPYVAWMQDEPVETQLWVSRLKSDGSAWERVTGTSGERPGHPRLGVSGGRLYLGSEDMLAPGPVLRRLNAAGTGWDKLSGPTGPDLGYFGDIADVNGRLDTLFVITPSDPDRRQGTRVAQLQADGSYQQVGGAIAPDGGLASVPFLSLAADGDVPYASRPSGAGGSRLIDVSRYAGGAWESLPSPSDVGTDAQSAQLARGASGGMWILFSQASGGVTTWYVAGLGVTLPEPTPGGGGGGGGDNGGGTAGGDAGGGGTPGAPTEGGTPTGHCANAVQGTAFPDVLVGTRGSDAISGHESDDRLFGYGGDDCLFGSAGRDALWGGPGSDRLSGGQSSDLMRGGIGSDRLDGGAGPDELSGGSGNDELNGDSGRDLILAGPGRDRVAAGSGDDRIDVRGGGSDLVDCGPGRDTVLIDRDDAIRRCEHVVVLR
jgi:hypothetical protein